MAWKIWRIVGFRMSIGYKVGTFFFFDGWKMPFTHPRLARGVWDSGGWS